MAELKLRKCPFCDSEPFVWRTSYATFIQCIKYNAKNHQVMVMERTDEDAALSWNGTQKVGHWIHFCKCSNCGHMDVVAPDYCSRCGSYNGE